MGSDLPSIFGGKLLEYWDAGLGYALVSGDVDTWTGQKLGTVVQAPGASQRPDWNAADAEFNGQPSIDFHATDNRYLQFFGANFFTTGSYFWCFAVFRDRSQAAVSHPIVVVRHAATGRNYAVVGDNPGNRIALLNFNATLNISVANADDDAHAFFVFFGPSGSSIQRDGGAAVTDPYNTAIANDCDRLFFAGNASSTGGDISLAWIGMGRGAPPSEGALSAALSFSRGRWGTP